MFIPMRHWQGEVIPQMGRGHLQLIKVTLLIPEETPTMDALGQNAQPELTGCSNDS